MYTVYKGWEGFGKAHRLINSLAGLLKHYRAHIQQLFWPVFIWYRLSTLKVKEVFLLQVLRYIFWCVQASPGRTPEQITSGIHQITSMICQLTSMICALFRFSLCLCILLTHLLSFASLLSYYEATMFGLQTQMPTSVKMAAWSNIICSTCANSCIVSYLTVHQNHPKIKTET